MLGVDISNHQGSLVDWDALKAQGVTFAYCKASEGVTFADSTLERNRMEASRVGIPMGAYHYALPAENGPLSEAAHFAAVVGSLHKNDLRPMLDLEEGPVTPTWARAFLIELERLLDVRPGLYSYPAFLSALQPKDGFGYLRQWPLWLADYGANDGTEHPIVDDFGFRVVCHQFTSTGSIGGMDGIDLDDADTLNVLRESGDYLLWRDWVLAGKPDPRPVGVPLTIPLRWQDAYDADAQSITQRDVPLLDKIASLTGERDSLHAQLDQANVQLSAATVQIATLNAKISAAREALA